MARTITYNEYIQPSHIYTASSGGTVFSANLNATASFDYFTNSAVVNDAMYFGMLYGYRFGGVKLTVGTAFAATSKTLVWEYYNNSAWVALSGVIDNTSALTVLGENTVTWTISTNWQYTATVNGLTQRNWVRCRISAVSGITEGGANATTAPTIASRAITIADPGTTVTGWPELLYQASVSGGWGVVSKSGTGSYSFDCHILVGYTTDASSTAITATKNSIEVAGLIWQRKNVSGSGYITFGTLVSDTDRTSKDGCYIKCTKTLHNNFADGTSNEQMIFYSSLLDFQPYRVVKAYNSTFNASCFIGGVNGFNAGPIFNNVSFQNARPDFIGSTTYPSTFIDKISVSSSPNTVSLEFSDFIKGLVNLGCTYIGDCSLNQSTNTVLIDPVTTTFNIYWNAGASYGNKVSVKYSNSWVLRDSTGAAIQDVNVYAVNAASYPCLFSERGRVQAMTAVQTFMTVDTTGWSIGDYANIGSEVVLITAGTYPSYTISRAQLGTSACVHTARQVLRGFISEATNVNGATSLYLVEGKALTYTSGSAPGITTVTEKGPFTFKFRKYGYVFYEESVTLTAPLTDAVRVLTVNPFVIASAATSAAYTGITIDGLAKTITVTSSHTIQELYDYTQWWASQSGNIQYSEPINTTDGVNFNTGLYTITVNGGVTLYGATAKITTTAYTIMGAYTGIITDGTTTRVFIKLNGVLAGSQYFIQNSTTLASIVNATASGSTSDIYLYTADTNVNVVVRLAGYIQVVTTGLISNTGLSVNINQQVDSTY